MCLDELVRGHPFIKVLISSGYSVKGSTQEVLGAEAGDSSTEGIERAKKDKAKPG